MYKFNNVLPPKLKDYKGDVLSIAKEEMTLDLGATRYVEEYPFILPIDFKTNMRCHFSISRKKYWQITEPPVRYAADLQKDLTIFRGYRKTERETIQKNSKINFGASGFGLSAQAANDLNITNETFQEWREETTEKFTQKFSAKTIYCGWSLIDQIDVKRDDYTKNDTLYMGTFIGSIACVISFYQDDVLEADIAQSLAIPYSYIQINDIFQNC